MWHFPSLTVCRTLSGTGLFFFKSIAFRTLWLWAFATALADVISAVGFCVHLCIDVAPNFLKQNTTYSVSQAIVHTVLVIDSG